MPTDAPRVLVLTAPIDPTADLVLHHLLDDGVPFLRRDPADFPVRSTLTATAGPLPWRAELDGVGLHAVESVYYRRPGRFGFSPDIADTDLDWCDGQARYGYWGVLESLPARWVNPPAAVRAAEYKPRQLEAARAAGLTVPPTLITNDPDAAADFAARHSEIITKPLYARVRDGVLYTEVVAPERAGDPAIATTAHLFQLRVDAAHHLRITAVGRRLFGAIVTTEGELDWRRDPDAGLVARAIGHQLRDGVHRLLDALGLVFGALDFVVTPSGEPVFLEINPNGQWGWVQHRTGQPIARALADLLAGRPR